MDPTIYKTGSYNTPCVYKGTGGIYNGRGVYNDGLAEFVEIGGEKYPVVKIGSQKWITKNLNYIFDTLEFNTHTISNSEPIGIYYNYLDYDERGVLYNFNAVEFINSNLPTGWRVPDRNDFQQLVDYAGGDCNKLKSKLWVGAGGTDEFKFNAYPVGYRSYTGNLSGYDDNCFLWTSESYDIDEAWDFLIDENSSTSSYFEGYKTSLLGVRICKNA